MAATAASPPPSPEYLAEYCGYTLVNVAIAFTCIEVFFVALRFLSHFLGHVKLGLDDYLIIPALILCVVVNSLAIAFVKYAGVGYHIVAVEMQDPSKIIVWAKFLIAIPCVYLAAVVLPKLAILCIYLRVFTEKIYRRICWIVGIIIVLSAVTTILTAVFECLPIQYLWDKTIPGGHCIDTNAFFLWASFPNIITDTVMLILPLPMVWKLQTSRNIKIGLTLTFLTGSIGLLTSILRFYSFSRIDALADGTWASVDLVTWTCIEPGVYLVAACLPTLRPLALIAWRTGRKTTGRGLADKQSHRDSQILMSSASRMNKSGQDSPYSVNITGQHTRSHPYVELEERSGASKHDIHDAVVVQQEYTVIRVKK